ncbi:MAG TPA: SDR family oxidoreductase [Paracoccaceae bacterium]|nr:SDR family oxidoreductase [Paracoccaceae bacterium]
MTGPLGDALAGRRVLVTGASGGIGAAVARACAGAGARVVAHGGSAAPEALAAEIGGEAVRAGLDGFEAGEALARATGADGLVHCAARQDLGAFRESGRFWEALARVNLGAAQGLLAGMEAGSAVLVSSVEATRPAPGHSVYAATKAGLETLARAAAMELAPLRVNVVSPGLTARPGLEEQWSEGVARWRRAAALGREVTAEEVAAACVFLLSDAASGITGAVLPVDAGMGAGPGW